MHAYVQNIRNLPVIAGTQAAKIHESYHTLMYNMQALETLGKLSGCLFMVRGILDKLQGIKAELVSGHKDWQSWDFANLLQALQNWNEIHPISESSKTPEVARNLLVTEAFNRKNKICEQRDVFTAKKTLTSHLSALKLHPQPSVDESYK